jgi:ABC-2 type transport system permease protein
MKALKHIWFIALKDLKIFTRDRASVFFFIVFPFLFIIMFNFLLKDVGGQDQRLEMHLATREAAGGLSYQIIGAMETQSETLLSPGQPVIIWDKDYDIARQAVEDKKLAGFVAFPADFTQALMGGTATSLEVFADAGNINTRTALNGLAGAISSQIGANHVIIKASVALMVESGAIPPDTESINKAVQTMMAQMLAGGTGGESSFITYVTEKVGEVKAENPSNYVIPGYLVMFVFFAAAMGAAVIVRERQNHTLERLLSTSVKRAAILSGIFTGSAIKGLIQIIIFWTMGILVFKVDLGLSPLAVIILSILMVLMSSAFAVMLATFARTERSAGSLGSITSLALAPLGGCWWPLFLYPDWLQNIAKITPHAWATTGFNKLMLFGADFGAAAPEMLALLGFMVIFGVIAVWRFRTSSV